MTSNFSSTRTGRRLTVVAAASALALTALGPAPASATVDQGGGAATPEYIPFVTDFPKTGSLVTSGEEKALDGRDLGVAGAIGGAVALAGASLALARRGRLARA